MARLTYLLLLSALVAISFSKVLFVVVSSNDDTAEVDLKNLPAPDKIITVNSPAGLQGAIEKIGTQNKTSTIEAQKKVIFIVGL
ncbi:hypothetical protein QR680_004179 [Steinernema hermaphroditum]|uniref:Uncharacterized protein n=1 Tax=Steinernema hermaphroditum TaxID=289476 RepID=A0AA39HMX0_9BILA|nr:hypothetical protein QR680_004179 [Steinernema hermaphroditum]